MLNTLPLTLPLDTLMSLPSLDVSVTLPATLDAVTVVAEADANASLMSCTMSSTLQLPSPLVSVLNLTSMFVELLLIFNLIP